MNPAETLNRYNVPTADESHHHVSHGWVGIDCLTCSPNSNRFRLGFEIATGRCNCWHCGPQNAVWIISQVCRITYAEAKELLGKPKRAAGRPTRPVGTLRIPTGVCPLLPAHRRYIAGRGFDVDEIERLWGVRGIGVDHRLGWRLWIPIRDAVGDAVSWTTRAIGDGPKRRYVSASALQESVPHKSILYGAELARFAVVVVEGPIDAWAIGPGAVATCGVGFTGAQLAALTRYPKVAVCFDSSADAQRRAEDLCRTLRGVVSDVQNMRLSSGEDPADVVKRGDRGEIAEIRRAVFGEETP